jgi:hypothetical protein
MFPVGSVELLILVFCSGNGIAVCAAVVFWRCERLWKNEAAPGGGRGSLVIKPRSLACG